MAPKSNAGMNSAIRRAAGRVVETATDMNAFIRQGAAGQAPQPSAQSEPYVTANAGAGTGAPPPRPGLSMNDAIRRIRLQYPNVTFTTGD